MTTPDRHPGESRGPVKEALEELDPGFRRDDGVGRLLWRCRRGTKELDVLLERYVSGAYPHAGIAERQAFEQILGLPDPLLTDYFFGHVQPADLELARLVERIATHRA